MAFCLQQIKPMTAPESDFNFDQSSGMVSGSTNGYSIMTVGNRGEDADSDLMTWEQGQNDGKTARGPWINILDMQRSNNKTVTGDYFGCALRVQSCKSVVIYGTMNANPNKLCCMLSQNMNSKTKLFSQFDCTKKCLLIDALTVWCLRKEISTVFKEHPTLYVPRMPTYHE